MGMTQELGDFLDVPYRLHSGQKGITMSVSITPINASMGAVVTNGNLVMPMSKGDFFAIHQAFLDHKVVALRGFDWNFDTVLDFGRHFGSLVPHILNQYHHPHSSEMSIIATNTDDEAGRPTSEPAGAYWHSDLSYAANPADAIILYALEIPSHGGDTEFANQSAAYEALPQDTKERISALKAIHRYGYSGGKATVELNQAQSDGHPDVIHPVVRTHRETGKKSLFVNPGFVVRILDMQHDESDQLLAELFDHQLKTEFRYRHTWKKGDLVCADNRATMHRAIADYSEPRRMWRMIVGGTG